VIPTRGDADLFVPDGLPLDEALARTTHLAVGAHQDDLEFMSLHGILACHGSDDRWYAGVVVTDGGGSPRGGAFAGTTDEEMRRIRVAEQRRAATIGRYGAMLQLMFPSAEVKDPANRAPERDLRAILDAARPETVYLHNPADRHDTHVACLLRSIAALRALEPAARPRRVYGCEVWRDLDWLTDADKRALPIDDPDGLGAELAAVFTSQIAGGKRYDLAVRGRWLANATFHRSHEVDASPALAFAIDLTPLIEDPSLDVIEFTVAHLRRTAADVADRLKRFREA
jgi:LmbE family N-acetylglucosaminyl deacetylase